MLVALCSLKGSPGVTTTALAMAACSTTGAQPVVVECDPAGGDIFARFRLEPLPGLVSLAAAARRSVEPGVLTQHTQRLPSGLPVVAGPAGAEQARAALGEITPHQAAVLRAAADQDDRVVLADCGRLDPDSPALPIVQASDALVLLVPAREDALAHVATRLDTAARWTPTPCLALIGDGYPISEVAQVLGISIMGRIPHDPQGAAILSGTSSAGRGLEQTPLGQAAARITLLTVCHTWARERADLLKDARVREARLHDARHTAATVLLVLGINQQATTGRHGLMGWSHNTMTTRYQHLTPDLRRDIADQVDGLLWTKMRPPPRYDLLERTLPLFSGSGQGRGRTADLPIFRTPMIRPSPVGTVLELHWERPHGSWRIPANGSK